MTFELSPEQEAARDRARAFAQDRLAAAADAIDELGTITPDLLQELQSAVAATRHDPTALVVAVEELSAVSPAAAAAAALGATDAAAESNPAGLRGFAPPTPADARARLVFAAIACGVARSAVEAALAALRDAPAGAHEQERPHWAVADAATDAEAARLLTLQAAQSGVPGSEGLVAMAKLAATRAAQQAVDAALRVVGAEALGRGTLLERLSRDVRALALIMGTEEELRATAAQFLFSG